MSTSARTLDGDLAQPRVIVTDFASVVRQQVIDGLSLWLSEWFLDQTQGFPWVQRVFGVTPVPSAAEVSALLEQFLLSIDGIASVTATGSIDRSTRAFSYSFSAQLTTGQTLSGGTGQPFTVTGGG